MIVRGNDFVTKEQFCSLCHISKKTAYKLIKSGRIKATKRICGLLHYYEIPISEISRLEKVRGNICKLDKDEIRKVRKYYSEKLKKYPDIVFSEDVQLITGYAKESVRKWIKSEKLLGIVSKRKFIIAKDDLLDFLTSQYYLGITRKSNEHISDFVKLGILDEGGCRI